MQNEADEKQPLPRTRMDGGGGKGFFFVCACDRLKCEHKAASALGIDERGAQKQF